MSVKFLVMWVYTFSVYAWVITGMSATPIFVLIFAALFSSSHTKDFRMPFGMNLWYLSGATILIGPTGALNSSEKKRSNVGTLTFKRNKSTEHNALLYTYMFPWMPTYSLT